MFLRSFLAALALAPISTWANDACLVVGVSDGDTLTARCSAASGFQKIKVRLAEIDAPEKGQAFGQRAKLSLSALCFGARATITPEKRDRYGRTVAKVECRGQDANAEQVRRGMAWVYLQYAPINSPLRALEAQAREARSGLWADLHPIAPWEWRASTD
jgi:endonuclease YncB( thermonuclease family)